MKISIGKKLGLGFGVVIGLMVATAIIAYSKVLTMNRNVKVVVDETFPAKITCERLRNGVNEQIALLRGYLILGANPSKGLSLKKDRAAGFSEISAELATLSAFANQWQDEQLQEDAKLVGHAIDEFLRIEQKIEDIAHTPENLPALNLLIVSGEPTIQAMLDALTTAINEEATVAPSVERRRLMKILADSRATLTGCMDKIRACMLSGDVDLRDAFEELWAENSLAFKDGDAVQALLTPTQKAQWQIYAQRRTEFFPMSQQLFTLRESDRWNKAQFIVAEEAIPTIDEIDNLLHRITTAAQKRIDAKKLELQNASHTLMIALIVATGLGVCIATLVATLLSRQIISTSRKLADRVQQIASGDLTGEALVVKSADELGQLAGGFDMMLSNLRQLTGQILSVTDNVNAAATQISTSTQRQASSTREQAATVQEITSTMQEVALSGSQIVEKARQVAAVAEVAAQQSKSGIVAVQDTSQTMESIREQVEEVAENIVALSEKTQAVGDIISTVNDIAEQSNLLALNATIEAADAGEDGNRFSVVANEMKNLADQAKECTIQVRNILGEIQKGINSAVMLTEEAVKRVESGKQQANLSEDAIRRMSESTDESVQAFQQIIGATNQQQVGFEQVSKGMQDIDKATQQTANGTTQLEQAVVSLSAMSQQLKSAVSTYKMQA